MVKSILTIEGVTVLSKQQQKIVNGGAECTPIGNHEYDWYVLEGTPGGSPTIIYCLWNCGGQTVPGGCL